MATKDSLLAAITLLATADEVRVTLAADDETIDAETLEVIDALRDRLREHVRAALKR